MSLSYMSTQTSVVKTEKKIKIYKDWGCYTSQANNSMYQKAKRFIAKIEKLKSENADYRKIENAFATFIRSHSRFIYTDTGSLGGAGDTEVRSCVWSFLEKVALAVNVDYETLDKIWEREY